MEHVIFHILIYVIIERLSLDITVVIVQTEKRLRYTYDLSLSC